MFFYGFTTLVCIRDCQHFLFDLCNFTNYITNTNCAQLSSVSIVLLGASWLGFCFYSLLTYIQSGKLFIELYQLLNATIYIKPINLYCYSSYHNRKSCLTSDIKHWFVKVRFQNFILCSFTTKEKYLFDCILIFCLVLTMILRQITIHNLRSMNG